MSISPSVVDRFSVSRAGGGVRVLIGMQIKAIARREAWLRYISLMSGVVISVVLVSLLGQFIRVPGAGGIIFSGRADVQLVAVAIATVGALITLIGWQQIRASQVRVELALLKEALYLDDGDRPDTRE